MSAVLSRNGQSLWVMAWLDELPKSAAAVPRSALLKMLAANDRMGNGKFFAYIPANRRFVLQRVVANTQMSNAKVRGLLIDLGRSVRGEYAVWSTEGWDPPRAAAEDRRGPRRDAGPACLRERPEVQRPEPETSASSASRTLGASGTLRPHLAAAPMTAPPTARQRAEYAAFRAVAAVVAALPAPGDRRGVRGVGVAGLPPAAEVDPRASSPGRTCGSPSRGCPASPSTGGCGRCGRTCSG